MKKLISFLFLFPIIIGFSQNPVLLKNCNPTGDGFGYYFTELNGKTIFVASNLTNNIELWITDGTSAGTMMLKEINANTTGNIGSAISSFVLMGNKLFFSANNGIDGSELWVTDGTTTGTSMVKDINTTANTGSSPTNMVAYNGKLYFSANDGTNGAELWVSDGSNAGTSLFKNINTVAATGSSPSNFLVINGKLFFVANDGVKGNELWITDGSVGGTNMVKDINISGTSGSDPANFTLFQNKLFFTANDGINGVELYVSDGTLLGTNIIKNIHAIASSSPSSLTVFQNKLFFTADNGFVGQELWVSDGTSAGTNLFMNINTVAAASSFPANLFIFQNKLFFSAFESTNGAELWSSDGTVAGTKLYKDIVSGANSSLPENFVEYNGKLYFLATVSYTGGVVLAEVQLYVTNGNPDSTKMLAPDNSPLFSPLLYSSKTFGLNYGLKVCNGTLYFTAAYNSSDKLEPYIIKTTPTGIAETNMNQRSNIYPNPVNDIIHIDGLKEEAPYKVINNLGQTLLFGMLQLGTSQIDISNLAPGAYVLQLENETRKIIKN